MLERKVHWITGSSFGENTFGLLQDRSLFGVEMKFHLCSFIRTAVHLCARLLVSEVI